MSKENGGPAFPCHDICHDDFPGMTLRDYFAAKAMAALLTLDARTFSANREYNGETVGEAIAHKSYAIADAMLAERSKP